MKRAMMAALLAGGMLAGSATAANAVTLNGLVWRQLTETEGLNWYEVFSVCGGISSLCSGDLTNDFGETINFDGWTWANRSQVGDLFAAYTIHPGGVYEQQLDADPFQSGLGAFDPTFYFDDDNRSVWGLTSDDLGGVQGSAAIFQNYCCLSTGLVGYAANSNVTVLKDRSFDAMGVWLYKEPSPVPLPAGVWLLLSALGGLGFIGWRRKSVTA
jgi:hypothetical protein